MFCDLTSKTLRDQNHRRKLKYGAVILRPANTLHEVLACAGQVTGKTTYTFMNSKTG